MIEEDRPIMEEPADHARVLLVEDGRSIVERIVSTLAHDQDELVVKGNTAEALADIDDPCGYDLIMISLLLAEEDGLRLCSHLRSRESTPANPDPPARRRGRK